MRAAFLLLLACTCAASTALAQDTRGNLQGRVLDDAGEPIPAVDVVLSGSELPGTRAAATNAEGFFHAPRLPVGSYAVELRRLGYQTVVLDEVIIRLGRT